MRWWLHPYKWEQKWIAKAESVNQGEGKKNWLTELIKRPFRKVPTEHWTVKLNKRAKGSNSIYTSNYTIFNFVPKFLYLQFKQFANVVFLALVLIQLIPELSPFGIQATAVPLAIIIICSVFREAYEEFRRRIRDMKVNYQKVWAHTDKGWTLVNWCQLHVGQAVRIENGRELPADVLFVASSETGGIGYIETANLDGESSLKIRQALTKTAGFRSDELVEKMWRAGGQIVCDNPNKDIHQFHGYLMIPGQEKIPISNANILYRGARLKNTDFVYGIAIYTGEETKLKMNNTKRRFKKAKLDQMTNSVMLTQFGIMTLLATSVSLSHKLLFQRKMMAVVFNEEWKDAKFIKPSSIVMSFFGCMMLFIGLVPISLYVSLEMIQVMQGLFIRWDREMYDEEKRLKADVKTFSLNSELGEVRYIMSDKTGTLTQNNMRFRQCSIGGIKYRNKRRRSDEESFQPTRLLADLQTNKRKNAAAIREFLLTCSVCHTVNTDRHSQDQERPLYHATSPDEAALVSFAADAGFIFHSRQHATSSLTVKMEKVLKRFVLLHVFEFTSERKRMSVVVKTAGGQIRLFVKGADHVIMANLGKTPAKQLKKTRQHLLNFASAGYRTLCFAVRTVSQKEWQRVLPRLKAAQLDLVKQQELLAELAVEIETNLELVGVSAIEDRLQDEVPQTIERMLSSGMRVWVLTGDKLETAVNIGNSCRLLTPRTSLFMLRFETKEKTTAALLDMIHRLEDQLDKRDRLRLALIIDAVCLDFILTDEDTLRLHFLRLAFCCTAVICCRCTPLQKAAVTRLVKKNADGCVLAIGDGANDVAMIQEADVGVGIAGEEGMQAALAADYSIAKFRFLDRLLFLHGTLSLFRTSKCILYSIYKNVLETTCLFLYCFFNGYTDKSTANTMTVVGYTIFYTSWPAIIIGTMDRPAGVDFFRKYSQMYTLYQNGLNIQSQAAWFGMGLGHGITIFLIMILAWDQGAPLSGTHMARGGRDEHCDLFGLLIYMLLVTTANGKAILETSSVTVVPVVIGGLSIFIFFVALVLDNFDPTYLFAGSFQTVGMLENMPWWPTTLCIWILAIGATLLPDLTFKVIRHTIYKDTRDAILWKEGVRGPNFATFYKPIFKIVETVAFPIQDAFPNTGFAFSQDEGEAITQMKLISGFLEDNDFSESRKSGSETNGRGLEENSRSSVNDGSRSSPEEIS